MKMKIRTENVFKVMASRNLTLKKLSEGTGINQSSLSRLISNKFRSIKREHIYLIAKELQIDNICEILEL
jgi:DNA-binding Xre family transcriptional regulator